MIVEMKGTNIPIRFLFIIRTINFSIISQRCFRVWFTIVALRALGNKWEIQVIEGKKTISNIMAIKEIGRVAFVNSTTKILRFLM